MMTAADSGIPVEHIHLYRDGEDDPAWRQFAERNSPTLGAPTHGRYGTHVDSLGHGGCVQPLMQLPEGPVPPSQWELIVKEPDPELLKLLDEAEEESRRAQMNERAKLLDGANRAVNGPRNAQYGDPRGDFKRTAKMWSTYASGVFERKLHEAGMDKPSAEMLQIVEDLFDTWDVAAMMNLLKASRISWTPWKEDSWMDTAGYAACGWECASYDARAIHND